MASDPQRDEVERRLMAAEPDITGGELGRPEDRSEAPDLDDALSDYVEFWRDGGRPDQGAAMAARGRVVDAVLASARPQRGGDEDDDIDVAGEMQAQVDALVAAEVERVLMLAGGSEAVDTAKLERKAYLRGWCMHAALHPNGTCRCGGEGTCGWCVRSQRHLDHAVAVWEEWALELIEPDEPCEWNDLRAAISARIRAARPQGGGDDLLSGAVCCACGQFFDVRLGSMDWGSGLWRHDECPAPRPPVGGEPGTWVWKNDLQRMEEAYRSTGMTLMLCEALGVSATAIRATALSRGREYAGATPIKAEPTPLPKGARAEVLDPRHGWDETGPGRYVAVEVRVHLPSGMAPAELMAPLRDYLRAVLARTEGGRGE